MRALILGGGGQLGSDLQSLLGDEARSFSHAELDISDPMAVGRAYDEARPRVVFNCAAFHNVEVCEREREQAWKVNVDAVQDLAKRRVPLVHVSTNYVFDGRRPEPYREDDAPSPRSIYALTKLAGEYCALAYGDRPLVVRSAGLYGLHGSASKGGNFIQRMVARARDQGHLRMVADQRLQPTYTADLAAAIIEAVDAEATGVLHLTATGACSWYEFTQAIMELARIDVPIEAMETTIPPGGVDRPLNGVLDGARAEALGLSPLRSWREALEAYMIEANLAYVGNSRNPA